MSFWSSDLDLWSMTLNFKVGLHIIQIHPHTKFRDPRCHRYRDMNYCLVNFGPLTDGQTDRQADRWKVTHKSPPCISTGGLKKLQESGIFLNARRLTWSFCNLSIQATLPVGRRIWISAHWVHQQLQWTCWGLNTDLSVGFAVRPAC